MENQNYKSVDNTPFFTISETMLWTYMLQQCTQQILEFIVWSGQFELNRTR